MTAIRGVGVDIADVDRFRVLYAQYGDRFARKWFADAELARCCRVPDVGAALAEHFAAKEAVWKALGPGPWRSPIVWRSIDVRIGAGTAVLSGEAAALAGAVGVHVSVSRQQHVAIATALVTAEY